jgi:vacuolar-type H+-ATPase subunit C/Vma6
MAPLGPAPLLAYALRLRAEMIDLRRIIWGVALAVPRAALTRDLVTV